MKPDDRLETDGVYVKLLPEIVERLARIETKLNDQNVADFMKEWYSVAEAAKVLGKASFTVREWARLGRINAKRRPCGRGPCGEWMISGQEIKRFKNEGLLERTR